MKHNWLIGLVLLLLLGLGAVGCTGEPMPLAPQAEPTSAQPRGEAAGGVEGAAPTPTTRPPQAGPSGTTPASATGGTGVTPPPEAQGVVWLSKEDLAQRLSLAPGDIRLVSVEAVDWSDTSLGCPQPGMVYAQVITPGFRVVLEAEGARYEYHTDLSSAVRCGEPLQAQDPGGETSRVSPESGQMPIFVEVVQTYLLSGAALETSLTNVPPNGVFAFDPASRTLLLRPSIIVSPETQVLVGQTTVIQSPSRPLARGELFQVPPSSTGPVEVIAVDTESGAVTLAYGDQTFELFPGQSRSFKQTGDQAAIQITIVTNSGRLASIEPLSGGPDAR